MGYKDKVLEREKWLEEHPNYERRCKDCFKRLHSRFHRYCGWCSQVRRAEEEDSRYTLMEVSNGKWLTHCAQRIKQNLDIIEHFLSTTILRQKERKFREQEIEEREFKKLENLRDPDDPLPTIIP